MNVSSGTGPSGQSWTKGIKQLSACVKLNVSCCKCLRDLCLSVVAFFLITLTFCSLSAAILCMISTFSALPLHFCLSLLCAENIVRRCELHI